MKEIVKKKRNSGFTVAEVLVTTIILLLATSVITSCITLAGNRFYQQVQQSEAQILCASLSTAIQDELTYASDAKIAGEASSGSVSYFTSDRLASAANFFVSVEDNTGAKTSVPISATTTSDASVRGQILLAKVAADGTIGSSYGLVSSGAYDVNGGANGKLRASMDLTYDKTKQYYDVTVSVFNEKNPTQKLATKTFHVGQMSKKSDDSIAIDTTTIGYTFTFEPNGSCTDNGDAVSGSFTSGFPGTAKAKKGSDFTFSAEYSPESDEGAKYTFAGWTDGSNTYSVGSTLPADSISGPMTFSAVYSLRTYTVTFDYDYLEGDSDKVIYNDIPYGSITLDSPSVTPTKKGYIYGAKWVENGEDSIYYDIGANYTVTGNVTFMAVWVPKDYKITFNAFYVVADGEEDTVATVPIRSESLVAYDSELVTPTREEISEKIPEGYEMLSEAGWTYEYVDADTGDKIEGTIGLGEDIQFTFDANPNEVIFETELMPKKYTVKFYSGEEEDATLYGSGEVDYYSTLNTAAYVIPYPPKQDGYTFTGWKYTYNGTTHILTEKTMKYQFTLDLNFYAQWEVFTGYPVKLYNGKADGEYDIAYTGTLSEKGELTINGSMDDASRRHEDDKRYGTSTWTLAGWYDLTTKKKILNPGNSIPLVSEQELLNCVNSDGELILYACYYASVYVPVTSMTTGNDYIITNTDVAGSAYAVGENGRGRATTSSITISSGNVYASTSQNASQIGSQVAVTYILPKHSGTNTVWLYTQMGSGNNKKNVLRRGSSNDYYYLDDNNNYAHVYGNAYDSWTYTNNQLMGKYYNNYYMYYDGEFKVSTSNNHAGVRIFERKTVYSFNGAD